MVIAQQSFHKWDSLAPSSRGWVCISGCSTPLELWRRVRCLVEMLGIYAGKTLKCLEVSFWWLNTHAQRMVGKIQKHLLISVDGITGNAACYMPWCSLCMLHALCMLSSDFSTDPVQFKKKKHRKKLDLNIKQRPNLKSSSRLLCLGKKLNANTHPVNSRDISSKANSVSLVNSQLFFFPFKETPIHWSCVEIPIHWFCVATPPNALGQKSLSRRHPHLHAWVQTHIRTCSQAQSLSVHANLHWGNKI